MAIPTVLLEILDASAGEPDAIEEIGATFDSVVTMLGQQHPDSGILQADRNELRSESMRYLSQKVRMATHRKAGAQHGSKDNRSR